MLSFLKKLLLLTEPGLTNRQYLFPYFFDVATFENYCTKYGLTVEVIENKKIKMPEQLHVLYKDRIVFKFPFAQHLMFIEDHLISWNDKEESLVISIHNLANHTSETFSIDMVSLDIGLNVVSTVYPLYNFATYIRKSTITYPLDYYDRYVVLTVNGNQINLIPFDWFNKGKGDYGYVWPALARLNLKKNYLIGEGMRMAPFVIDLATGQPTN